MKKILQIQVVILLALKVNSQNNSLPNFESLKLNSSPAYVVLGIEPENIQRPSSPTKFISGLQNSIVNGKLKPNIAFEVTPYYWSNPKKSDSIRFNPSEYLLAPSNFFQNIIKTTAISFATSESDTVVFGKLKPGTALGMGIKFLIAEGKPTKGVVGSLRAWNEAMIKREFYSDLFKKVRNLDVDESNMMNLKDYASLILTLTSEYENISLLNPLFNGLSYSYSKKIIQDISNDLIKKLQEHGFAKQNDQLEYLKNQRDLNKAIEENKLTAINESGKIPFTKQGFMLEFAAGQALVLQNNNFNETSLAKSSVWVTPSYRWQLISGKDDIKLFDLMGVLRYTFNNIKDSVEISNYLESGLKLQYTTNNLSFSFEGVYRYASELPQGFSKHYTWRWASVFDYKLNDLLTFKFSFGGNFNGNTASYTKPKDMFVLGGLNLGMFNPQKKTNN